MTDADYARSIAARVRIEARRPHDGESELDRLQRLRDGEKEADTLERFAGLLESRADAPSPELDNDVTPPAGTSFIPQAATQTPAGAPPSVLPTESG